MRTSLLYLAAALAEIAGCFSFWTRLRNGRSGSQGDHAPARGR